MRVNGPTPTAGHTASIHNGVPRRTLLSPPADRLRDHVGRDRLERMGYGLQFAEGTRGGRHPPGSAVHLDLGLHLDLGSPSTTFAAAPRSTFHVPAGYPHVSMSAGSTDGRVASSEECALRLARYAERGEGKCALGV